MCVLLLPKLVLVGLNWLDLVFECSLQDVFLTMQHVGGIISNHVYNVTNKCNLFATIFIILYIITDRFKLGNKVDTNKR